MKKALITGVTGQDGSYLAELLLDKGYEVHGLVRRTSLFNRDRIEGLNRYGANGKGKLELHYGDVSDSSSLTSILKKTQPDEVYHLAAQSHVGVSFEVPEYTADVTGLGSLRLLEAIRNVCPKARFYQASTSELFGNTAADVQSEITQFEPKSPYAIAKLYAYWITNNYRDAYGMYTCNGILFNHESPRRGENFVTRKITLSLAGILSGKQKQLRIGNLNARRDWGHAKEYVEGMWRMLQQPNPDDYVLCTGESYQVRDFIEIAFKSVGIVLHWEGAGKDEIGRNAESGEVLVVTDPNYFRPIEVHALKGDNSKAKTILGWEPQISFEALVRIMVRADLLSAGVDISSYEQLQNLPHID